jgi:hypothetical protein
MVEAFRSRIDAYGSEVQAEVARINGLATGEQIKTEIFKAYVDLFSAQLQGEVSKLDATAKAYAATISGVTAKIDAEKSKYLGTLEGNRIVADVWKVGADVLIGEANLNVQQVLKSAELNQEAMKSIAAVNAQLASAALSIVNVSASYNASESDSHSSSYTRSCTQEDSA